MGAKNTVIAGNYQGCSVTVSCGVAAIITRAGKREQIDNFSVESYEIINNEQHKSAVSGITRGLVGGMLGPVGAVAGVMSAKNKGTYQIAIKFKNGDKSLIEVDDKIYKAIIQACF